MTHAAKPTRQIEKGVASVVALATGAATIYGLLKDGRIAVLAIIGMVFALVLLSVVARAAREVDKSKQTLYDTASKVLVVFVLLYFMGLAIALFPKILQWLSAPGQTQEIGTELELDLNTISAADPSHIIMPSREQALSSLTKIGKLKYDAVFVTTNPKPEKEGWIDDIYITNNEKYPFDVLGIQLNVAIGEKSIITTRNYYLKNVPTNFHKKHFRFWVGSKNDQVGTVDINQQNIYLRNH